MTSVGELCTMAECRIIANPPIEAIYDFKGQFRSSDNQGNEVNEGLGLENTIWANTVAASQGFILGIILHTGKETRMAMNTSSPRMKIGQLDSEVNWLSKVLFLLMILVSLLIIALDGFAGKYWWLKFFRINLLLCSIIPISMRINLDLAKIYYSWHIQNDPVIPGCIVRNSTIPEELGRI